MRGFCYFCLSVLTQASSSASAVVGLLGHNVTLPCRYDARTHGALSFCWGRGVVPISKCSDTILSSRDGAASFRESPKYRLLGSVTDGDVSLTILDARRSDAGVYGCRLEFPGWFNDEKVNIRLVVEEAPEEQPVTQDWTPSTVGRQEILTASMTTHFEPGEQTLEKILTTEEKFKALLEVGDIGRVAVIFFLSIIIILIFVFRKRKRALQRINTSTAENIYEVL